MRLFISFIFVSCCISSITARSVIEEPPILNAGDYTYFIENKGQWNEKASFRGEIPGGFLYMHQGGFTYNFISQKDLEILHSNNFSSHRVNAHALQVEFVNANIQARGRIPLNTIFNYYKGRNPDKWVSGARGFEALYATEIYQGIDLEINGTRTGIKYNFIVKAGSDPGQIRIKMHGADSMYLDRGDLVVETSVNEFVEYAPVVFQYNDKGEKVYIESVFQLENRTLSFKLLDDYDPGRKLIIDPEIIFSTYSGSKADNFGYTATYDDDGYAYAGGTVYDDDFPTTDGAYQIDFKGGNNDGVGDQARDIGILKFTPDGTDLVYATYLGGNGNEDPHSIVVNPEGQLIIFGNTYSEDFPVTPNAYDNNFNGGYDIYLSILSSDGTELISSTYIGGSERDGRNGQYRGNNSGDYVNISPTGYNFGDVFRGEVITDEDGNVYVASVTASADFPVTPNAFQQTYGGGISDAVVFKMDPELQNLEWSTFLGGNEADAAFSIKVGENGNIYLSGGTASADFPVSQNAYQNQYPGGSVSGFAGILSPDGEILEHATFYGSDRYDQAFFVSIEHTGDVFITGQTEGTLPVSQGTYHQLNSGQFIAHFNPDLTELKKATVFGTGRGRPDLSPSAFLVDECGRIYFSGWGGQTNSFPGGPGGSTNGLEVTANAFQAETNGSDFYLAIFSADLQRLIYATFMGDPNAADHVDGGTSRFDANGIVYQSVCASCGSASGFPTTPGAWSTENQGLRPGSQEIGCNNALLKMDFRISEADFDMKIDSCYRNVEFIHKTDNVDRVFWDFGDGHTSEELNPVHHFEAATEYEITLINFPGTKCADTVSKIIDLRINSLDDLVFPNIFSPDGDDINDLYYIRGLELLKCDSFSFRLFNRWGTLIFESDSYFEWDGQIEGGSISPGVYYYIFKSEEFEETGSLTIVR